MATIPQQGQVRQLKHYIISVELFWKEKPEQQRGQADGEEEKLRDKQRTDATFQTRSESIFPGVLQRGH